jgi:1,4-dihydroxy-2-naphthoyl-CoA hydrolase
MTDARLATLPQERWLADFEALSAGSLPGLLGVTVAEIAPGRAVLRLPLRPELLLTTGYIHAGTVVALADTSAGYGCRASLPEHAGGFTTIELKVNLLASAADGDELRSEATLVHGGQTTQVWDAHVTRHDGRTVAVFRCTQLLLARRQDAEPGS